MPVKFLISRSDVTIEASYQQPQFGLLREDRGLYTRLASRLTAYGLKLSDMKIERGNGSIGEYHLFFYLLDYLVVVRIRVDRTEIYCSQLTADNKTRVLAAAMETLVCVREAIGAEYRVYTVMLNIHGVMENQSSTAFLRKLIATPPAAAGAITGNGIGYYFAATGDRTASSLVLDVSAIAPDGLYAKPQATWDPTRVPLEHLAEQTEEFVRATLGSFDIEVP